jgi:hypothetical protein
MNKGYLPNSPYTPTVQVVFLTDKTFLQNFKCILSICFDFVKSIDIYICKTAKVMLTVNLCVKFGLYNGAIGSVFDIIYPANKKPTDCLPNIVMVDFPNYTGPPFINSNPKVVPLVPVERKVDCSCHGCKRKQIPLRLGWALTIHKCQGMTVGKDECHRYIVINPGTRAFESRNPGALFVALSRAKSAGNDTTEPDFAWHSSVLVNEDRLCHVVNTKRVKARTAEISRILLLCENTKKQFNNLYNDSHLHTLGNLSSENFVEE